jgi:hypothetical protein
MNAKYLNINDPKLARQRITKKAFEKLLIQIYKNVTWEKAPGCNGDPATTWYWNWFCENWKPVGVWENGYAATPYKEDNQ